MTGIVLLLLARDPDGKLSHALDGKQLRFSREGLGISPTMFLSGYRNNCLSVNGFRMGLTKVGKILGAKGEGRVGIAFDVDIVGDDAVLYNVSREKIIGEAAPAIRQELRHAILRGLKETGIYDQLAESTKDVLALALERRTPKADNIARVEEKRLRVMQEEILTAVAGILPSGKWPLGLHRMVAAKLGIPNSWAWTAIGELRRRGVAEKADERQQGGGAQIR